jgi:hypothetical protein
LEDGSRLLNAGRKLALSGERFLVRPGNPLLPEVSETAKYVHILDFSRK